MGSHPDHIRPKVAVIIPCYRVTKHILGVIAGIGEDVDMIFVIDDACPDESGRLVETTVRDPRVRVVFLAENQGVGGAVLAGYRHAIGQGAEIMVKIDGDGQMDPALLGHFVRPIAEGRADYTKGNRFFLIESLKAMPAIRIFGNAGLSFLSKISSGYWHIFDPTNGYTAIHANVAAILPYDKIDRRYFFETDMLFRLNTLRSVVLDIPMVAHYGEEVSNLNILAELPRFFVKNLKNIAKRLFYNYFLRDFSVASIELILGVISVTFGVVYGLDAWSYHSATMTFASSGTVMLAGLPVIVGTQLVLSFLNYDMSNQPREPIHPKLSPPVREPQSSH